MEVDENQNCTKAEDREVRSFWEKALLSCKKSDEDCEPQRCVMILRDPTIENYGSCRRMIQNADPEWMEGFLRADGLQAVLSSIDVLGRIRPMHVSDVLVLEEAVACFRAVANSRLGLQVCIESGDVITKLFQAFDIENEFVKTQVVQLMSAFCVTSEEGLQKCIIALDVFKTKNGYRNRFKPLMIELRSSRLTHALAVAILGFINCIITSQDRYGYRCATRLELLGLGILRVIQDLSDGFQDEDHEHFAIQCQIFRDHMAEDDEADDAMEEEEEVALHLFNSIYAKIKGTQLLDDFVNILLHLSQLNPDNPCGSTAWSVSSSLTQRISTSTSAQLQTLLRINHIVSPPDLDTPRERKSGESMKSTIHSSEDEIDEVDGPSPPPPPPGPPPPPSTGGAPSAFGNLYAKFLNFIKRKPSQKMKHVQWSKIPQAEAIENGTIWKDVLAMKDPVDVDYDVIEKLFCKKTLVEEKDTDDKSKLPATKKSSEIHLLKYQRGLTISIFLRQFKMSSEDIISLIRNGQGSQLGADRLQALLKILPDEAETNLLKANSQDCSELGNAEKFLIKLISLPMHKPRIEGLLLELKLKSTSEEFLPNLQAIRHAGEALLSNQSLLEFLRFVLHAGNFVNAGSYAGNAAGIRLDSLEKIADTKSEEKTWPTLLHYLVEASEKENPEILQFVHQLQPVLKPTEGLVLQAMIDEIDDLKSQIDELSKLSKEGDAEVRRQFTDFILSSEPIIKELEQAVSEVHSISLRIIHRFCEDEREFIVDKFLENFNKFCTTVLQFQKDNHERKRRMERMKRPAIEEKIKDDVDGCLIERLLQEIRSGRKLRPMKRMAD
ncbi:hypothetical protein CAPTEDRAFT_223320 [Capitella teleta]|uniref:FH2 domain-containing protein n=1 Tax=Capitella teleta TaxID=283909 RepID=R7UBR4_CAPTE|nr:hypothetical protein CAPTEDRAFT_223320 [Capitella teleta]|eukprot:ELU03815.1 hypothetical protein CAPTEDRAFT_223320 [Capitella teleta]